MKVDYNSLRFSNKESVVQSVSNIVSENPEKVAKLLIKLISIGDSKAVIPLLRFFDKVLNERIRGNRNDSPLTYDIAFLVEKAACEGNPYAIDMLLQAYSFDPDKCCILLSHVIYSNNNRVRSIDESSAYNISDYTSFQLAFCNAFGIATRVDHNMAWKYITNPSPFTENEILHEFLIATSDNSAIAGSNKNFKNLSNIITSCANQKEADYLNWLYDIFNRLFLNGFEIMNPYIGCFLNYCNDELKGRKKLTTHLFAALASSLSWTRNDRKDLEQQIASSYGYRD